MLINLNIIIKINTKAIKIRVFKFSPIPSLAEIICVALGKIAKNKMLPQIIIVLTNLKKDWLFSRLMNFKKPFVKNSSEIRIKII